jgi:MFS family permease
MTSIATIAISFALVLNMAGYLSVAAILPQLLDAWHLTEAEAGWLASCHMGVYAVAAVLLLPMTDRWETKTVILWSLAFAVVGGFGFAWLADDFWSGIGFRAMVGIAQAGVYMPGLKLIADSLDGRARSRATALYSSMIPIGSGLSLLLPVVVSTGAGWQPMFELTGIAGLVALALVAGFVPKTKGTKISASRTANPYAFAGVLRNRAAMKVVLSYAGHVWETFGFRVWIVAFLAFASTNGDVSQLWVPDLMIFAAAVVISATPVSILVGNWAACGDRRRLLRGVSLTSLGLSIALAACADADLYTVMALAAIYGVIGFADQGALGSAIVDAAEPEYRGATLAIYTLFGFGFGMLGAVVCGVVLQVAGGIDSAIAWQAVWLTCGLGALAMSLLLAPVMRKSRSAVVAL